MEPNHNNKFARSPEFSGGREEGGQEQRVEDCGGRSSDSPATLSTLTLRLIMQGKVRTISFFIHIKKPAEFVRVFNIAMSRP